MTIRRLNGVAALMAAETTHMRKNKGEASTEFVKRIVNAYLDADEKLAAEAAEAKSKRQEMGRIIALFERETGRKLST